MGNPSQNGGAILQVRDLSVISPKLIAVNNVSFYLHPGDLLGLLGPNGAGKMTLPGNQP